MSLRYVQSVVKRSCISITNVLSVTAYNTLATKPTVKKFCWKNKCHFLPNKKFRLVLIKYRFSYAMRHNDANNFNKINSFLKLILNILILCNLIVGWDEGVIKERAGILHQIYRFRGGV